MDGIGRFNTALHSLVNRLHTERHSSGNLRSMPPPSTVQPFWRLTNALKEFHGEKKRPEILQFGNAFFNSATPALVILVSLK